MSPSPCPLQADSSACVSVLSLPTVIPTLSLTPLPVPWTPCRSGGRVSLSLLRGNAGPESLAGPRDLGWS